MNKMNSSNTLIVIPARAGSKRVPRKNIRSLAGKPLIAYAIEAAKEVESAHVAITSDDEEVCQIAERAGLFVHRRPPHLCNDEVPLDPVIIDAVTSFERETSETVEFVVTLQPTCPFIRPRHISHVVSLLENAPELDTVISVTEDRHLRWGLRDGEFVPLYAHRINSQLLPMEYRETGGILACRRRQLDANTRIGRNIGPLVLSGSAVIDIDTFDDFRFASALVDVKRIVFAVTGSKVNGLGHVYRALTLATELVINDICFVCAETDDLAIQHISSHNYKVEVCREQNRAAVIKSLNPNLIINDVLDTDTEYMDLLKQSGAKIINFEDLGPGSYLADVVFNALYEPEKPLSNYRCGISYFCLRQEFRGLRPREVVDRDAKQVVIVFGGVDEGNLTCRAIEQTASLFRKHEITADVIVGPGYRYSQKLYALLKTVPAGIYTVYENTRRISDLMIKADFGITSAGRTAIELMSLGVPSIVMCQNSRESTHTFAREENGIFNLGNMERVTDAMLSRAVADMIPFMPQRAKLRQSAVDRHVMNGIHEVVKTIEELLRQPRTETR